MRAVLAVLFHLIMAVLAAAVAQVKVRKRGLLALLLVMLLIPVAAVAVGGQMVWLRLPLLAALVVQVVMTRLV